MNNNKKYLIKVLSLIFIILVILYIYHLLSNTKEGMRPPKVATQEEKDNLWSDWQQQNTVKDTVNQAIKEILQFLGLELEDTNNNEDLEFNGITLKGIDPGKPISDPNYKTEYQVKITTGDEASIDYTWISVGTGETTPGTFPEGQGSEINLRSILEAQVNEEQKKVKEFIMSFNNSLGDLRTQLNARTKNDFSMSNIAESAVDKVMGIEAGGKVESRIRCIVQLLDKTQSIPHWKTYQRRRQQDSEISNKEINELENTILRQNEIYSQEIGNQNYEFLQSNIKELYYQGYKNDDLKKMMQPYIIQVCDTGPDHAEISPTGRCAKFLQNVSEYPPGTDFDVSGVEVEKHYHLPENHDNDNNDDDDVNDNNDENNENNIASEGNGLNNNNDDNNNDNNNEDQGNWGVNDNDNEGLNNGNDNDDDDGDGDDGDGGLGDGGLGDGDGGLGDGGLGDGDGGLGGVGFGDGVIGIME